MRGGGVCPLTVLLAGCHLLLPFSNGDSSSTGERPAWDRRVERARADGSSDRPASRDRPLGGEGSSADRSVAAEVTASPCVTGATQQTPYSPTMIQCVYPTYFDQCEASKRCNTAASWHLCTAAEYVARGGKDTPPPVGIAAWLDACVRENGVVQDPFVPGCSGCDQKDVLAAEVNWLCTGASFGSSLASAFIGVHTYAQCWRVGTNVSQNDGRWRADPASMKLSSALCCAP